VRQTSDVIDVTNPAASPTTTAAGLHDPHLLDGAGREPGRFKVAGKPPASAQLTANETLVCRIIS
jgi:hypothetical protein